jgi:hypothetical protein
MRLEIMTCYRCHHIGRANGDTKTRMDRGLSPLSPLSPFNLSISNKKTNYPPASVQTNVFYFLTGLEKKLDLMVTMVTSHCL